MPHLCSALPTLLCRLSVLNLCFWPGPSWEARALFHSNFYGMLDRVVYIAVRDKVADVCMRHVSQSCPEHGLRYSKHRRNAIQIELEEEEVVRKFTLCFIYSIYFEGHMLTFLLL